VFCLWREYVYMLLFHNRSLMLLTFCWCVVSSLVLCVAYRILNVSSSQSYIITDGQSASVSWCQAPISDPRPIILLLSLIIFRQLRVHWCVAPSLTRGRVCGFQLSLGIASAVFLGLSPTGLMSIIFLSFRERKRMRKLGVIVRHYTGVEVEKTISSV
jgi:hypothetical protein